LVEKPQQADVASSMRASALESGTASVWITGVTVRLVYGSLSGH
jgi:hypothetical protein